MRIIKLLSILSLLALPVAMQAQFTYVVSNGTVTITKYTGQSGTVIIPDATNGYAVTGIGVQAFSYDETLTNVVIPNSITSIGEYAFYNCLFLTGLTIPNSVTNIAHAAFHDCTNITSITIPNSVTSLGDAAFEECSGLTDVTIPANITNLGVSLFQSCVGLTNVTIANTVTSIGESAFEYSTGLTSISIPSSVTNIGDDAFMFCSAFTSAYFQGNAPPDDGTVFSGDPAIVYYLPGTKGWKATFGGVPTMLLTQPEILVNNPSFGVSNNQFGFTISGATNSTVVVQAVTNLENPLWVSISTNSLTKGTFYFSDPNWSNYPGSYYRVIAP